MPQYQVVGELALAKTETAHGPMQLTLYKGAVMPGDVPADQIKHLLSVGLIAEVSGGEVSGGEPSAPTPSVETPGSEPPPTGGQPEELSAERAAARAELPSDGSPPPATASKAVWVEAAVVKGYDYEAAAAETKNNLIGLLKG